MTVDWYIVTFQASKNSAEISSKKYREVLQIAKKANKVLKCRGITRCDFRFHKDKFFLLEVNTQPGMTSLSLVPEIAKNSKISFLKLIDWMIKDASINRWKKNFGYGYLFLFF